MYISLGTAESVNFYWWFLSDIYFIFDCDLLTGHKWPKPEVYKNMSSFEEHLKESSPSRQMSGADNLSVSSVQAH